MNKTLITTSLLLLSLTACGGHNVGKKKAPAPYEPKTYELLLESFKPVDCKQAGGVNTGHLPATEGISVVTDEILSVFFNKYGSNVRMPLDVYSNADFDRSYSGRGNRFASVVSTLNGDHLLVSFSLRMKGDQLIHYKLELWVVGSAVEGFETIGTVWPNYAHYCTKVSVRYRMVN